jgi:hypothetical protein
VFEVVNDGLGTINYITPQACGQVVQPPAPNPDTTTGTAGSTPPGSDINNIPSSSDSTIIIIGPPTSSNNPPVDLNESLASQTDKGALVALKVGMKFIYTPRFGSDKNIERTITITGISPQGVTFLMQPTNQVTTIRPDQTLHLDFDSKQRPRLAIRLRGTPTTESANINIWLLSTKLSNTMMPTGTSSLLPAIAISTTLVVLGVVNMLIMRRLKPARKFPFGRSH